MCGGNEKLIAERNRGRDVSRTAGSGIPRSSRRPTDRWSPQHEPREFQRADESYRASQLHREVQADRHEERLLRSSDIQNCLIQTMSTMVREEISSEIAASGGTFSLQCDESKDISKTE